MMLPIWSLSNNAPHLIYFRPFGAVVLVEGRFSTRTTGICVLAMMAVTFGMTFAVGTADYDPSTLALHEDPIGVALLVSIFAILGGMLVLFRKPGGGSRNNRASEAFRAETRDEIAGLKRDVAQVMDQLRARGMLGGTRPAPDA